MVLVSSNLTFMWLVLVIGSTGLGGVVWNSVGDVMVASAWHVKGNFDADVSEAMAARHGLTIAVEAGFRT